MTLPSRQLGLQAKVSFVIILIVGLSAASDEYVDRVSVGRLVKKNFQDEVAAVARQVGAHITTAAEFRNHDARALDLYKLQASRPDLLDIALYALPVEGSAPPALFVSAGNTALPRLERVPLLVLRALRLEHDVTDLAGWEEEHRLKIAAPISVEGKLIGAAYAEFSTAQFDEVLDYQRTMSLNRRLLTGSVIVLALNLFLYWKVHRPVKTLLAGVEAVSQGVMSATVPVQDRDEIGQLGARFNAMVERIRIATEMNRRLYEELRQAHDNLQLRVEEATAEIRQKNRELLRTNELLSTMQREAVRAQRLSAIGQLAATVAHRIGTPLTALSGHIQLLSEDEALSPDARRRLQAVEAQIERTSRIIQDLLIYARKPEPVLALLDLNQCLEECTALLRPEMTRRTIRLVLALSPALPKVEADQSQLQELFTSLIENALDAMSEGGTLTIHSHPAEPSGGDQVAIEIEDTGSGIKPEHLDQIFQPFFTTKQSGRGTGLGLAIAYEAVKAHAGQLDVHSEVGKGTRFTVTLPITRRER